MVGANVAELVGEGLGSLGVGHVVADDDGASSEVGDAIGAAAARAAPNRIPEGLDALHETRDEQSGGISGEQLRAALGERLPFGLREIFS